MKTTNLFILNLLLIGGLTIPTCNKAKAAEKPHKNVELKISIILPSNSLNPTFPFKNYPQEL